MPRGGKQRGAGRPKGSKSATTLIMEDVKAEFGQRVLTTANRLFNAQLAAAEGVTFLFKRKKTGGPVERVTSEREIKAYLDSEGGYESEQADGSHYYWIAAERPNADAADRLLNRIMGKPKESIDHGGAVRLEVQWLP